MRNPVRIAAFVITVACSACSFVLDWSIFDNPGGADAADGAETGHWTDAGDGEEAAYPSDTADVVYAYDAADASDVRLHADTGNDADAQVSITCSAAEGGLWPPNAVICDGFESIAPEWKPNVNGTGSFYLAAPGGNSPPSLVATLQPGATFTELYRQAHVKRKLHIQVKVQVSVEDPGAILSILLPSNYVIIVEARPGYSTIYGQFPYGIKTVAIPLDTWPTSLRVDVDFGDTQADAGSCILSVGGFSSEPLAIPPVPNVDEIRLGLGLSIPAETGTVQTLRADDLIVTTEP